jgi:hypothetical protein
MTNQDFEVIDRYGRRVRRTKGDDGIVADGQGVRVPLTLMDATNSLALRDASAQLEDHQLSAFAEAVNGGMSLADAIAKAKGIKRIEQFDARGHRPGFITQQDVHDAYKAGDDAREARDARVRDAYKNPAAVLDAAKPQKHVALVPPTASHAELFKARDQAAADRDRRLETAWKS